MARYEHLPIFKKSYQLALDIEQTVQRFSRYHKYTLGQDLRNSSRAIIKMIVRVNHSYDKNIGLDHLRVLVAECQVVVRLSKDTQAFPNFKRYEAISRALDEISHEVGLILI